MRTPNLITELKPYWDMYTNKDYQGKMKPLKILFELSTPILGYDPISFDGLLARLIVDKATNGKGLNDTKAPFLLPVPLKLEWKNKLGFPLWSSNCIEPVSEVVDVTEYHHKRFIREEHAKLKKGVSKSTITPKAGRFKEKRMGLPGKMAIYWATTCIGDVEEVYSLLKHLSFLGKKRAGVIESFYIEEIAKFEFTRFVPVEYCNEVLGSFSLDFAEKSWTSPYWIGVPETRGWCCIPKYIDFYKNA